MRLLSPCRLIAGILLLCALREGGTVEDYLQVMTTTETQEDARRIARTLVEKRLAACVQVIGPLSSTYWWQDKVEEAQEYLCLIKTRHDRFEQVAAAIRAVHPYEVPEILAVPVASGSRDYLAWLDAVIGAAP